MPRSIRLSSLITALWWLPTLGLLAQQPTPGTQNQPPARPPADATGPSASGPILQWLEPQFSAAESVSRFASQRAEDQQVRAFATQAAQAYATIVQRLQSADPLVEAAPAARGGTDISEELQDVAERIQEQVDEPRVTPRGRQSQAQVPAAERSVEVDEPAAIEETNDERGRLGGRLLGDRDNREAGVLERIRTAVREGDRRGPARERLQQVLPALRESAPELVALLTDVIEEGGAQGESQGLQLQQALSDHYAQSVQEELARYQGEAFAQAYLGYAILANLRLEDALQVARQQGGQQAAQVLDDALQTVQSETRQARKLMDDLTRTPTARR